MQNADSEHSHDDLWEPSTLAEHPDIGDGALYSRRNGSCPERAPDASARVGLPPACITQIMAVENGLKMKPSLSQSSPSGFPVWCYCSLPALVVEAVWAVQLLDRDRRPRQPTGP